MTIIDRSIIRDAIDELKAIISQKVPESTHRDAAMDCAERVRLNCDLAFLKGDENASAKPTSK